MPDKEYVRQYFSTHAAEWLAGAYGEGGFTDKYPIGAQRVRIALESVVQHHGSADCALVDMGCGGGDLCVQAAKLGMTTTGVDIAEGMIQEAQSKAKALPQSVQKRVAFIQRDLLHSDLPSSHYDAATALGLLEYLPEDRAFFLEAFRLLKPGGVLAISCRNRLFNFVSVNDYTKRELEGGAAQSLIAEMADLASETVTSELLRRFVGRLREMLPRLEQSLEVDIAEQISTQGARKPRLSFGQPRRQHSPRQVAKTAEAVGFIEPAFVGVHPHMLPPALETSAPRFYNQLVLAFDAFERSPLSLVWSSAFIAVFTKPMQAMTEV